MIAAITPPRARKPVAVPVIAALILWEGLARLLAGSYLLAGPGTIVPYLAANSGLIARATAATLREAAAGFVIGNAAAVGLALAAMLVPRSERILSALALAGFCLPMVATGPILRVMFGPGAGPQIAIAALAVYYTTYLALLVGLRAAPATWFELVRSYGRGRFTEILRVRSHAALPYLIAGLQIAAPAAVLGAMVGEFTGAERGLGVLALRAMRSLDVTATWAVASVAATLSILTYAGIGWAGRRLAVAPPALILSVPPAPGGSGAAGMIARGVMLAVLVLVLWHAAMTALDLNPYFAKRPADVWAFLVTDPGAAQNRAVLGTALAQTLAFALPGYVAGLTLGAGLALGVVLVPGWARPVLPVAVALRSVPIITLAPLIALALGRGAAGTVTIVAVMIFFPTLVACLQGIRQTPGRVMDVFATYAAGRGMRLVHAEIPAMLPAFFAAARMAVPAALLAATTAEWLATGTGMGALMALTASTSAYAMLWSVIVVLTTLAFVAYVALETLERAVLRRYAGEQLLR